MHETEKLVRMIELQVLVEQSCQSNLAASQQRTESQTRRVTQLSQARDRASNAIVEVLGAPTFCPDRLQLVTGQLSVVDQLALQGETDLERARAAEQDAMQDWQIACQRVEILAARLKAARRKEARKGDLRMQSKMLSLDAAIGRGIDT